MEESVSNANANSISAEIASGWVEKFKLNHGIIINKRGIYFADCLACNFESQPKINILSGTSAGMFQMNLVFSIKQSDSFLLTNNIGLSAINSNHISWVLDSDKNPLTDESPVNDIYLEMKCSKAELIFEKESIKPSKSLIEEVINALEHNNPYRELIKIFKKYGHFLPRKVILGRKLYRMSYLILDEKCLRHNDEKIEWKTLDDFKSDKHNDILSILNTWESNMNLYNFDTSHLISIDGNIVMRDQLDYWVASCLSDRDSLQIINWSELYPIYDIFDEPLCKDVKCILGINDPNNYVNEKVLKAGVIPIEVLESSYYVEFSITLKSNNYRIFGKLMTKDGEPKDEVVVKFKSADVYGFFVVIGNFDSIKAKNYMNLQITWILIGKHAEIGIFDKNTRNVAVICSENTSFTFQNDSKDLIARLKVPENLSTNSILITSIKYPRSNYEPNFITSIKNYNNKEIEINVYAPEVINESETSEGEAENTNENEVEDTSESEAENNNENEVKNIDKNEVKDHFCEYSLDWCIILPENQVKHENDNSCLPITMTHLKAIG
ncbi:46499_t:CDS:2, partial [Gigaspora margarita]